MPEQQGHARSIARRAVVMAMASFLAIFVAQAIAAGPDVVEIEEPAFDAKPLDPEDVHMVAEFAAGEHVCSDWQIWTAEDGEPSVRDELAWEASCATGQEKVHIHLGDGGFLNSYEGRLSLLPETAYVLRVRSRDGSEDASEWAERLFTTREPGPVGSETETWRAREGYVVETFAEDLRLPTKIAMVPNPGPHGGDPFMYVTELYGDVKVVTRDGTVKDYATGLLNFEPTGNFPGSGEMGLTGIVVEPDTGDVLVSLVYEDAESSEDPKPHYPKVVRLLSSADGLEATGEEMVLDMKGALQGASHQVSNLAISPGGHLFVHNGDGGLGKDEAPNVDSYLGKILRLNLDGDPVADNPYYDGAPFTARDYVYARGFRNPFGGGWRLSDGTYWQVENGPQVDRLAKVVPGDDYLWPGDMEMKHRAAFNWNPSTAPTGIEFVEPGRFGGSGFPAVSQGHAFVAESGPTWATGPQDLGKSISEFELNGDGSLGRGPIPLVDYAGTGKATVVGLAAGPDGLYFTDLYKEKDYESPVDGGANVLRIRCTGECPLPGEAEPKAEEVDEPPVIERFKSWRKRFAVGLGRRLRALRARASASPRGTAFVYALSERSRVWIGVRPFVIGWRVGRRPDCGLVSRKARQRLRKRRVALRRCVLPEARGVRRACRCQRGSWNRGRGLQRRFRCVLRGPRGAIRGSGKPSRNVRVFPGRLRGRWLRPGLHLATIRARDTANQPAKPRYATFRVVRGR